MGDKDTSKVNFQKEVTSSITVHVTDQKRSLAHLPACVPPGYVHKKQDAPESQWWTRQNNWVLPTQLIPEVFWQEFKPFKGSDEIRVSDRGGGGDCMFRVLADALNILFHSTLFEYGDIREIIAAQVKTPQIAQWLMRVYVFTEQTVSNAFDDQMLWRPSSFERDSKLHKWSTMDEMIELKNVIRTCGQVFWGDAFMLIMLLDTPQCFLRYSIDCYVVAPSFVDKEKRLQVLQIPTRDQKLREFVLFILFTGTHYELIGTRVQSPSASTYHVECILARKNLLPIHKEWIRRSTLTLSNTDLPQPLDTLFDLLK